VVTGSKDFYHDYMVDYGYMVDSLPRDSLSEGRGRRLEQGLQPRDRSNDFKRDCMERV
jgi:hypothetical protein